MINLLPPDAKASMAYARRNTRLARWSAALLISFASAAVIVVIGSIFLNQSIKANNAQIADMQNQLKVQKLEDTEKRVQDISNSLKLVIDVLGKEVLFSKLLQQIGAAMPPNTILTNFSINKLQGGIDLQASATNYQSATQVQVNLQDPNNKIFNKADIVNIQCANNATSSQTSGTAGKYPCTVTVRAQFAQNNPFLFISKGAKP